MANEKSPSNVTKHTIIVFLLWVAAPVAWFLMWRDKKYHSWFPHLLWINGVIFAVVTFFSIPMLVTKNQLAVLVIPAAFCLSTFQIWTGITIRKKVVDKYILPMIITFIINIGIVYLYAIL